ncbi:MAG: serine/threonine protein kinase [Lentisphaeraceae bacterium]|nr:serine/threonine protein kinase [Lentisphaeraceae bacterium]
MIRCGDKLGKYILEKELGEGALGCVWYSKHPGLGVPVAVKILKNNTGPAAAEYLQRFLKEGRLAAALEHQNIVRVYDSGYEGQLFYLVMEYIDGANMQEYFKTFPYGIPCAEALDLAIDMADILALAHSKGIVHRDIKPENILRTSAGILKLADLGIAKQLDDTQAGTTMSGVAMGTPYYISPEQAIDASTVDHRCDIYSLGCTLYQMLTGSLPFSGKTPMVLLMKHVQEPFEHPKVLTPELPDNFCAVICKMMEKNPAHRYQNCTELKEDLLLIKTQNVSVDQLRATRTFSALEVPADKRQKAEANSQNMPQRKTIAILLSVLLTLCTILLLLPSNSAEQVISPQIKAQTINDVVPNVEYNTEETFDDGALLELKDIPKIDTQGRIKRALKKLRHDNRGLAHLNRSRISVTANGIKLDLSGLLELRDITALRALPIYALNLDGTSVQNPEILQDLPLRSLSIRDANIEISQLMNLALEEFYYDSVDSINDLQVLHKMPLKKLHLVYYGGQSLRAFAKAPLEELKFEYAPQLTDISTLSEKSIHILALPSVQKESFSILKKLPLKKLYINGQVLERAAIIQTYLNN